MFELQTPVIPDLIQDPAFLATPAKKLDSRFRGDDVSERA